MSSQKSLKSSITIPTWIPLLLLPRSALNASVAEEIFRTYGNNINPDDFIIGFVFRNQLRKSVPNLLEGFKVFKEETLATNDPVGMKVKSQFSTSTILFIN